ncbi:hypothetical protein BDY19DRAFT_930312 [Irpex rosettiformis]|uniref:Uncharacterized protein n=1 Tax=Irpex rosettiformis TaxID=378272 RepID=A0ACB8UAY6_9APHY|nr:hypothetical protein BDY19DRAFT_930312 [Irpex rosettiformis]
MSQSQRAVLLFRLVTQVQSSPSRMSILWKGEGEEERRKRVQVQEKNESWRMGDRNATSNGYTYWRFRKKCTIHTRGMCISWRGEGGEERRKECRLSPSPKKRTRGLKQKNNPLPFPSQYQRRLNATLRRSALDRLG